MNSDQRDAQSILLVEDDPDIVDLLEVFLQRQGYAVTVCTNGDDALEKLKTGAFAICIMDVMLPGKDGCQVIGELRRLETGKRTPVILLSALAQKNEIDKGIAAGADAYITKPYENANLLEHVKKLLTS